MQDWESIYDALRACVHVLGGFKKVGPMMRPTFGDAAQWLRNCVNAEHPQKLDPEQVMWLLGAACHAGFHDAKHWFDRSTHYQPTPPAAVEAQLANALKQIQAQRRNADEAERVLTAIKDNPKLRAVMAAANIDVEALLS